MAGRIPHEANAPAVYDKNILMAIRAMVSGKATEGQQKLGMDWIINHASRLYDMSYRSGDPYATAFAEGRRFPGSQIVKMLRDETLKAVTAPAKKAPKQRQEAKPND